MERWEVGWHYSVCIASVYGVNHMSAKHVNLILYKEKYTHITIHTYHYKTDEDFFSSSKVIEFKQDRHFLS